MHHVLISNDDGVYAPGLRALASAFLADGWRVTVCAPDTERSAASHSITIKKPIVAAPVQWEGIANDTPLTIWKTDGTPADCVKLALHALCDGRPDAVVSGINDGWNTGTDVHYSGTVGAAMEGAFEGVPAVAVSASYPDDARYAYTAALAVRCTRSLLASPLPLPSVLNINTPACAPEDIKGIVEAPLTCVQYSDRYDHMPHTRGRAAYWIRGDMIEEGCLPGGDLDMLTQGYATVTALGWDIGMPGACKAILQD